MAVETTGDILRGNPQARPPKQLRTSMSSRICTLVTSLVCLAGASVAILSCESEKKTPISKFVAAYAASGQRPLLLRIAALPYVPAPRLSRGTSSPNDALRAAAYGVLVDSPRNATVEDLRANAAARLIVGQPAEVAKLMRQEVRRRPAEPLLWNDYAVALYE